MAELRDILINVEYYGNACAIKSMSSKDGTHVTEPDWTRSPDDVWCVCSCKLQWRVPRSKASDEELEALFKAHLSFATRLATRVD